MHPAAEAVEEEHEGSEEEGHQHRPLADATPHAPGYGRGRQNPNGDAAGEVQGPVTPGEASGQVPDAPHRAEEGEYGEAVLRIGVELLPRGDVGQEAEKQ